MLTTNCNNCGQPKDRSAYGNPLCGGCDTHRKEAEQHFAAENPEATESQILYAGRQALTHLAHHAHRNYVDPRAFSGQSGMIPKPPGNAA